MLDKIASQPHTITSSGRLGISYRHDRGLCAPARGSQKGVGLCPLPLLQQEPPPPAWDTLPRVPRPGTRWESPEPEVGGGGGESQKLPRQMPLMRKPSATTPSGSRPTGHPEVGVPAACSARVGMSGEGILAGRPW